MLTEHPTQHEDVNKILNLLLANAKEILKDQFVGMYLYGSLSSGDFDPNSSDIDFLVITESILTETTVSKLEAMHNNLWKAGLKWAPKLEGSYVHRKLIRRHDPDGAPCPTINEGKFYLDKRGSDWIIQRHVIRECGIVLAGIDPKLLVDYVSPEEIREAVLSILHEWWFPMLNDRQLLRDRGNDYHIYAIISMCRALHALEHGTIVSKPKAIQWARSQLNERWVQLLDKTITVTQHKKSDELLDEAFNFIRFTKEQVK